MSSFIQNLRFSDRETSDVSADLGQPPYENDTFVETFTETKSCAIGKDGIRINYDLNTIAPKYFEMTKDGVVFAETGQPTYTTGLGRLCAVQQAFQAVELPPNATTLKINDTILLKAGTTEQVSLTENGVDYISPTSTSTSATWSDILSVNNLQKVLDNGNNAVGANARIILTQGVAGTGGLANPQLFLENSNTDLNSMPVVEMYKNNNLTAGELVAGISMNGKDATGQKTEFARIQVKTENVASGNEDGTLSIFNAVNGVISEVFNFNGGQNENNSFRPLDLNSNALITSSGNLSLTATGSSGSGVIYFRPKEVAGTETIKVPLSSAPSDELVIEKSANYTQFYQTGGALNTSAQLRLGNGGLRLITINPSVAPTLQLDNGAFATATHQYSGNNYNLSLPTALGTLSTTNVSTLSLNSPNTAITNPSGQLNISANTNMVLSGSFNTFSSTTQLDIQTPSLIFTGAGLQSASSGGSSGQHLIITLNGTQYKIKLENM